MWITKTERLLESMNDKGLSFYYSDPEQWEKRNVVLGFHLNTINGNEQDMKSMPELTTNQKNDFFNELNAFCQSNGIEVEEKDMLYWSLLYHSY